MNRRNLPATAGEQKKTNNMQTQKQTVSGSPPRGAYRYGGYTLWLCLLLGLALPAKGQTIITGPNISGTWSPSGNPYIVADNCTITSGQTLTIQPGVVVEIASNVTITASGGLIQAVGTPSQRITVTSAGSAYWNTILLINTPGTDRFHYCDFVNANTAIDIYASGNNSQMFTEILNCTFSNCISQAVYGFAYTYNGQCNVSTLLNTTIENCTFSGTSNGCVMAEGSYCGGAYYNTTLYANLFYNLTGTAFLMIPNGASPTATFINNTVVNCASGVQVADPWNVQVQDDIFVGCTNAVTLSGSLSRTVSYNDFYNNATNFTGYPAGYGTVIWDNRNGTPADVFYNIFQNPLFVGSNNFQLTTNSPCVNAGTPGASFANLCFPPSIATNFPDLGAYGGPYACNWLTTVPVLPGIGESFSVSNNFFWLTWGAIPRSSYQILYSLTGPGSPSGIDSNDWLSLPNGQVEAAQYYNQFAVWPAPSTNGKAFFSIQSLGRTPGN
jgi:hypothetical protein